MGKWAKLVTQYRLRLKRQRYILRALRKGLALKSLKNRTKSINPSDILLFSTVRNEVVRLPYFLEYYRKLGVNHFLFVDNASDDGTRELLSEQPDCSVWTTSKSYKKSRFGMDWMNALLMRYGNGHWCLTVDADELFTYPFCDTRPLLALTSWLDSKELRSFGALMLDLYPQGRLDEKPYAAGDDPTEILTHFDHGNYVISRHHNFHNLWIQGGVRARKFFGDDPKSAPSLNKIPLVKWYWRYTYDSSTHKMLPRSLNKVYDDQGGEMATGVLLHTKFLHIILEKTAEELRRGEHYNNSAEYISYQNTLKNNPVLWDASSTRYENWRQLEILGLMSKGDWT